MDFLPFAKFGLSLQPTARLVLVLFSAGLLFFLNSCFHIFYFPFAYFFIAGIFSADIFSADFLDLILLLTSSTSFPYSFPYSFSLLTSHTSPY